MTPTPSPTSARATAAREYTSYWAIVWEQFLKNRVASLALLAIIGLFALAIYAPIFSSKLPFVWQDSSGVSFPWFRALLFNRNAYASGIDIFFNLLLVLTPLFGVTALVVRHATLRARQLAGSCACAKSSASRCH